MEHPQFQPSHSEGLSTLRRGLELGPEHGSGAEHPQDAGPLVHHTLELQGHAAAGRLPGCWAITSSSAHWSWPRAGTARSRTRTSTAA
eukprot:s1736_g26.t1